MAEIAAVTGKRENSYAHSLFWALPYLVFATPGILSLLKYSFSLKTVMLWACLIGFFALYIWSWLAFKLCPRNLDKRLVLTILVMLGFDSALVLITNNGAFSYYLLYVCSIIMLLVPKTRLLLFLGLVCSDFALMIFIVPFTEFYWVLIVMALGSLVTFLSRNAIEISNQQRIALVDIEARSTAQERNRVSAQLHDILGQTLTAINLNSQLIAKQLERAQLEQAKVTADTLTKLSREALADVRGVVKQNYTLDLDEEITKAKDLLETIGIDFQISGLEFFPPEFKDIAAWLVREGTANIVHHAKANQAWLVANETGMALINDGGAIANSSRKSGNGLLGLKLRANEGIEISWQVLDRENWQKWQKTEKMPKHGPGFILMLELK